MVLAAPIAAEGPTHSIPRCHLGCRKSTNTNRAAFTKFVHFSKENNHSSSNWQAATAPLSNGDQGHLAGHLATTDPTCWAAQSWQMFIPYTAYLSLSSPYHTSEGWQLEKCVPKEQQGPPFSVLRRKRDSKWGSTRKDWQKLELSIGFITRQQQTASSLVGCSSETAPGEADTTSQENHCPCTGCTSSAQWKGIADQGSHLLIQASGADPQQGALLSHVLSKQLCWGPPAFPSPASCLPHTCLSAAREHELSRHEVKWINVTRKEMGSELSTLPLTDCSLGAWMGTINSAAWWGEYTFCSLFLQREEKERKGCCQERLPSEGHWETQRLCTWLWAEPKWAHSKGQSHS